MLRQTQNGLVEALVKIRALDIQRRRVLVQAVSLVRTVGAEDIDVRGMDITADRRATAGKGRDERLILLAGLAVEPTEDDILDRQRAGVLLAKREVLLAITLRDLDGVIDVIDRKVLKGDIADAA